MYWSCACLPSSLHLVKHSEGVVVNASCYNLSNPTELRYTFSLMFDCCPLRNHFFIVCMLQKSQHDRYQCMLWIGAFQTMSCTVLHTYCFWSFHALRRKSPMWLVKWRVHKIKEHEKRRKEEEKGERVQRVMGSSPIFIRGSAERGNYYVTADGR